jgi:predicted dehydrogenase
MTRAPDSKSSRRRFLQSSATVAAAGALASQAGFPAVVSGVGGSDTLRIGLVGCGGRGNGAALQALAADRNAAITALGDVFEDQLQSSLEVLRKEAPERVKVSPERCFLGFDSFQKVIDSDVDVVLLCTPPGFRPQHLKAAVDAGKHSFVEISCAVDAPGVRSVLESAEVAKRKNLAIVSGCCWRYHFGARAALEQIRGGAIGEVRSVYATYLTANLQHKYLGPRTPNMTDLEWQIRDWYNYTWLSGDVTVLLMGGHSVDKMAWWLDDEMPRKAVGTGSRVFPVEGNTYDNCFVAYEYAGGVRGFLACRAHDGCHGDYSDYIIGTKGTCTVPHGRVPEVKGETNWRYTGPTNNMHQTEHDELFASIRAGRPVNDGRRMAHTTLMAMMGRMAAYTGQEITWEQALNSQERLVPEKLDWNMKLKLSPRALPGLTKFA